MSAYIVEDECINSIVTFIVRQPNREWQRSTITEALANQGTVGSGLEEQLGNAMFELNCNAVEQRYGDGEAKAFRDLDYHFAPHRAKSLFEVYDEMGRWIYQCSEGDVPENKLFQAIQTIYNQLAHEFVSEYRERK